MYLKYIDFTKNKNIFKISGRNIINNTFTYDLFNNHKNIFKENNENDDNNKDDCDSDDDDDSTNMINNIVNDDKEEYDNYYTCFYKLYGNVVPYVYNELTRIFETNTYDELNVRIDNFFSTIIKIKKNNILGITYYKSSNTKIVNI